MRFSERIGLVRRVLQKESMDAALKNALWNTTHAAFWSESYDQMILLEDTSYGYLLRKAWVDHFFQPIQKLPTTSDYAYEAIHRKYEAASWAEVYDFIEFAANQEIGESIRREFIAACNKTLAGHLSAYRFIETTLAPITSEEEIIAIEQALSHGDTFKPVVTHLDTALARLGDRNSPDYRNSIKESISALEALCKIVTGDSKATLGQTLKKIGVHPALEKGFSAIYGWTSDDGGIRHALSDEPTVNADDAKFFLVACSAFVNYLIAKSSTVS